MKYFVVVVFLMYHFFLGAQLNLDFAIPTASSFDVTSTNYQDLMGLQVKLDNESNVITIGVFNGTFDFDPSVNSTFLMSSGTNGSSLFIQKLSSSGNFIFAKKIDGVVFSQQGNPSCSPGGGVYKSIVYVHNIESVDLEIGVNGDIHVSGLFNGTQDFDPGPNVSALTSVCSAQIPPNCCGVDYDQFILKLDPLGNFIWVRQIDLSQQVLEGNPQNWNGYRNFYGISLDESDNVFAVSRVAISVSLVRFSSLGTYIGQTDMGSFFEVKNFSCQGGTIVFTGDFRPSGSQAINLRMVVSDTLGNVQNSFVIAHQTTVGCSPTVFNIASHTVLSNGSVVIVGDVSLSSTNCGNQNIDWDPSSNQNITNVGNHFDFAVSYKQNGDLNWINTFNLGNTGLPKKGIRSIARDSYSNIFILGEFNGMFDFNLGVGSANLISSNRDVFLLKLDSISNFIYVYGFSGSGAQYGNHLDVKNCDVAFVGTVNQNSMNFSTTGTTNLAGPISYLAKYSCCQIPVDINLSGDTLTCLNDQVTLSVNQSNTTLSWYNGNTLVSSNNTLLVTNPGTFTLNATNSSGCFGQDQVTIVADTTEPILDYNLSDSVLTCQNPEISGILNLSSSNLGAWSLNNTVISTTASSQIIMPGNLVITTTGLNGCTNTDSIVITSTVTYPSIDFSVLDTLCAGQNLVLIASGNGLINWNPDLPNGNMVYPTVSQFFTAYIIDSLGCENTDSVYVNVIQGPNLEVTSDTICLGESANLSVTSATGTSIYWQTGQTTVNISLSANQDTSIYVFGILNGCYSDTLIANITVLPNASVEIEVNGDSVLCVGGAVNLISSQITGNFWSTGQNSQTVSISQPQWVILTNSNPNGCNSQDSINITTSGFPCLEIIGVFSPNDDGINDNWEIPGIEAYPKAEVSIFNRWGQLLFFSIGYTAPWNGKFNNEPLPTGDYFYIIDLVNGTKFNGSMTLKN